MYIIDNYLFIIIGLSILIESINRLANLRNTCNLLYNLLYLGVNHNSVRELVY